jgi:hypothetical protein
VGGSNRLLSVNELAAYLGIPITEVSRWLSHKSIEVTHQIYGHLVPSSFDRARIALDKAYQQGRRSPRKTAPN